jgi:uncharacterized membrane protein
MSTPQPAPLPRSLRPSNPFRRAVVGGLGIVLPPLLTIVIFVWVGNTVADYVLEPLESTVRWMLVKSTADIQTGLPITNPRDGISVQGTKTYKRTSDNKFVPLEVYNAVEQEFGPTGMPTTALKIYHAYVDLHYLKHYVVIPIFLCVFVLLLYLLGKFMAVGFGNFFWTRFEHVIHHLPLIRNVYSSVKQVTDYLFTGQSVEYTRVIAVEYPRKGMWALAFVTGEGILDVQSAANEAVLSLLIPTSPMPFTGFTGIAKKSECLDLDMTIDQALQYIISCGVVVPPHQLVTAVQNSTKNGILPGSVIPSLDAEPMSANPVQD